MDAYSAYMSGRTCLVMWARIASQNKMATCIFEDTLTQPFLLLQAIIQGSSYIYVNIRSRLGCTSAVHIKSEFKGVYCKTELLSIIISTLVAPL
jgi:hypothetical protein